MAITKSSVQGEGKPEARADTSTPSKQQPPAKVDPTTYRYVGGLPYGVIVNVDGTNYEFRPSELVHLAHPVDQLDRDDDFERVEVEG